MARADGPAPDSLTDRWSRPVRAVGRYRPGDGADHDGIMSEQRPTGRANRPGIECRTISGRTVWVKRDAIGIAMLSYRREDVDPAAGVQRPATR